ncbi:MAG: hypothetical protein SFY68_15690, partial [Candidatus Sumerlaeia bacterium]|nr:hypothetical protein [Candidatus Sumerlaeia bacterium]
MTPRKNHLPGNLFPVMGFFALASTLTAQPVVEDFEKPESKFSLVRRQNATANNAQLVRGEQTPSDPEMGHAHAAGFALKLTNSAKESDLNAVLPNKITREEIAQLGGVLFSADIYLPAAGEPQPATALSVPSLSAKSQYAMYRFGVTDNAAQVFFSFSNGVDPSAILHHKVPAEQLPLRRP